MATHNHICSARLHCRALEPGKWPIFLAPRPAVVGGECRSITPNIQNLLCFGAFEFSINEFREPVGHSIVLILESDFNATVRVRTFTIQLMFRQYKRKRFICTWKFLFSNKFANKQAPVQQARCCSTGFIFSNILMLRVTLWTLLLSYLILDVISNPVNLTSGK